MKIEFNKNIIIFVFKSLIFNQFFFFIIIININDHHLAWIIDYDPIFLIFSFQISHSTNK